MARLPLDKAGLRRIAGRSFARYIKFVHRTARLKTEPADVPAYAAPLEPFILAFWHGQFMLVPMMRPPGMPIRVMVARHGDGETLAEVFRGLSLELIRGAGAGGRRKDRGGVQALREAVRALESGSCVAMTADVPPGPARRAGLGIVTVARLSGRPILPIATATRRYWSFDTWSRMTLNLPFGRMGAVVGRPIYVAADADAAALEQARADVEAELNRATARAYELAGADPSRSIPPAALDPSAPPAAPGFGLKAYRAVTRASQPAAPYLLSYRQRRGKEDAERLGERLGRPSRARPPGRLAWFHAASVGETNAILPLLARLRESRPDAHLLVTTGTTTSAALAERRLEAGSIHQYAPLDTPAFTSRFLDHWRPDLAVFTESEIWPNLILEGSSRKIPLVLVNGRMSSRSFGRWKRNTRVAVPLFGRFDVVLAQNEKLARRFATLGARTTLAVGNLKIDAPPPPVDTAELVRLQSALGNRPFLVAASTHTGEEAIIAEAHRRLVRDMRSFLTIIAPRHPERGAALVGELRAQGFSVAQRSCGELPGPEHDFYIADTIGELGMLYALGIVAFIGGSLIDRGGQNPIEAIRHNTAVITGPSWHNFKDEIQSLLRQKGAIEVRTAEELAAAVHTLLTREVELMRMLQAAQAALGTLSGALDRTVEVLLQHLPRGGGTRFAS
jgi:3-deoxy-D-manno-octulosonic-acid transferase